MSSPTFIFLVALASAINGGFANEEKEELSIATFNAQNSSVMLLERSANKTMTDRCLPGLCPLLYTGIIADKEFCSRYIKCEMGFGFHHTCDSPKMFDDKRLVCDDPAKVDCGTRKKDLNDKGG
ncbi:hypothetical protein GN156_20550, partial [bacterium LRH843]|nr:hypothetical protein [bacterium LRH843]